MRILCISILIILIGTNLFAADWVDQGDGTWTCSVTFTATTTTEKDQFEQCRSYANFRTRLSGQELSASEWLEGMMFGIEDIQHPRYDQNGDYIYDKVIQLRRTLWDEFTNVFVSPASTDRLTDGLAVVVPSAPADPSPRGFPPIAVESAP